MTEPEQPNAESPEMQPTPLRKRRWPRRLGIFFGVSFLVLAILLVGFYFLASSAAFEDGVRRRLITTLEDATGGRVEIATFHWDLLHLTVEATSVTIHGLEAPNEAPYAHVDRLHVEAGILGLFTAGVSPTVILHAVEIDHPTFHLIVYPDGSTNQPQPKHPSKSSKPVFDTFFDARIGKLTLSQGSAHIADQVIPLDLEAHDTSLQLGWLPAPNQDPNRPRNPSQNPNQDPNSAYGSYQIALSLGELTFLQGPANGKIKPVSSRLDAAVILFHNRIQLQALHLAALDRTLTLSGDLQDFNHPAWQAQARGQVDVRVLAPTVGFLNTHSGILNLNATATGHGSDFLAKGDLSGTGIHYQDAIVDAQVSAISARFQLDPKRMQVSAIRARVIQGGELTAEVLCDDWLETIPKPAVAAALRRAHQHVPTPVGTVRASLNGISLDTLLTLLASPQYRKLGLDTIVSGPATATWTGFADDLEIGGQFTLTQSATPRPKEVPVNGSVDATYQVATGSVKVRTLDLHLPHSSLQGKGSLGVFPINRASEMDLDLVSSDLGDFDGVLRTLDLKQGNRTGTAALPVTLQGQAQFHGQLNSSWLTPRVEGHLTATNIGIEIPAASAAAPPANAAANPQGTPAADAPLKFIHWDSIDLDALYTPASIVVHHGTLRRGAASITLEGKLDSYDPTYNLQNTAPAYDENSVVGLKANVQQFPIDELLPLAGVTVPVKGTLNAQLDIQGALNALTGSGTVDLAKISAYGESVEHLRATGAIAGQQLKITSLSAQQSAAPNSGQLTATGTYDLKKHNFQIDARGTAIDLASIQRFKQSGLPVTGKLGFTLIGNGTVDDPHLQTRATFSSMTLANEPVADLLVSATSSQHAVTYDLSSHQQAGEFSAHGQTSLNADYTTQASLQFSKFDIGSLLKLLHVTGITGQSDLEGSAKLSGPLAHLDKISGEASLHQLAVVLQGVHLQSKGPVHASLASGLVQLDPVEITGEDTDLKLHGSLAITGKQQLDLQANGSVNMRLAESLDPDLIATGVTSFQMEAHGPVSNPILQGKVEFQNASIALQDFPNGLSQIKGTLEFIQNRLEVRSLTAVSGGGQISVAGYIGFQRGLYADLTATCKGIRIRYPQGISSLADAKLRLQGPQNNLQLSGNVEVTRFSISTDLDLSAFSSGTGGVQPVVSPDAPSNHIRLDVHLTSAPQLNFQNALAKLAGDVDLHIRGTLAAPSVLGRISLTEGSASFGGTQYELQRGDIYFNNPVRIQPNIDLDATARVEDYDITLGVHGTPDKLKVSYRSEPPLPEADVIALLALGRTQDEQRAYSAQQQQAGDNPMTDALLGGALNATVTNRVQRLFGTGAIKVDPNFIGSLGNSSARVTVVEQIGKNLTFTYASNVNTTTQQLIQAEIAVNHHVSLLVTQDESGIFSIVVKARRRYK